MGREGGGEEEKFTFGALSGVPSLGPPFLFCSFVFFVVVLAPWLVSWPVGCGTDLLAEKFNVRSSAVDFLGS